MSDENQNEPTEPVEGEIVAEDPVGIHGRINRVDLRAEMERSYLDYAMAVIIGRALPDVRDGLKPVHLSLIHI